MTFAGHFAWPEALPLLLIAPLAMLLMWAGDRARARRLVRVVGQRAPALSRESDPRRRRLRRVLFGTALLLALLAVVQPVWGAATRRVEQRGVDLVVGLDVSRSMLARDVSPSRLLHAKREIRALAERAAGDRLGLVLFAGEARLAVPLTRDRDSFAEMAALADAGGDLRGGTDLGAALTTALGALVGQTGQHEAVLLLTDGEDHEERGMRVAQTCRERNITVHCIGFGSTHGAKIPVVGEGGEAFLRDGAGAEVVSVMDPATLRRIAETTGGVFVDATETSLVDLYEAQIAPMARKIFEARERRERENRFQWPLLGALLFWMVDSCLGDRRRR